MFPRTKRLENKANYQVLTTKFPASWKEEKWLRSWLRKKIKSYLLGNSHVLKIPVLKKSTKLCLLDTCQADNKKVEKSKKYAVRILCRADATFRQK